ncbi:hypothetical protein [Klebsiella phage phiKp_21]|uniref:Uncharacterized protein n=1 Tax=Klebsiella phage vB_KleM_RaK2 TaxID=1147094 RepID=H6X3R3_9CAUD|nr:virion structural protein [Klebsiella phage vB_KleM_RaK2]YP_010843021.1 virion structural protein [Klebsiella phage K64-1]AFA44379.1 hypothetical protein RaK2_00106 [Klebsiella phage vB_KleM_RaK2]BEH88507.1 hypothetical protein [Klebsiella phage phiKp_21]
MATNTTNTEFERINGFSYDKVLGYFYGKNALASIAVSKLGNVDFMVTGAISSFVGVQRFLNTELPEVIVAYLNEKGIIRVDGTPFVVATLEADYNAAYAAQLNLQRIVDIVQQRAVILSTSEIAGNPTGVAIEDFTNAPNGVLSVGTASIAAATVVTFMIERADVFDKNIRSFQGVPSTEKEVGRLLIDDLTGVPMLAKDGVTVVPLLSTAADAAGDFAIKMYKWIPALVS